VYYHLLLDEWPGKLKPRKILGDGIQFMKRHLNATITKEVVLAYPDFSKPFEIYTDASKLLLGAAITQDNRPIMFFSRKLFVMQTKNSVTEIELLAIVETRNTKGV
jgi:hypothetical protein